MSSGRPTMEDQVEVARGFTERLAEVYGASLRSVLLYGSVPRGDAVPGASDVNLLVLVDRIHLPELERLTPLARQWLVDERCTPMLIGREDWPRAGDAFAIEISEMHDHRQVVFGDDPLIGVKVDRTALRSQAEHELRGRLVQLHEALMMVAMEPERVGGVLVAGLPSFATYFRVALRLAGRPAPARMADAVRDVAALVGGDPAGCMEVVGKRVAREAPRLVLDDPVTVQYYDLVRRVLGYVDGFQEGKR